MNCLTEALGLSLPGNGSMLATHADREGLFKQAANKTLSCASVTTATMMTVYYHVISLTLRLLRMP